MGIFFNFQPWVIVVTEKTNTIVCRSSLYLPAFGLICYYFFYSCIFHPNFMVIVAKKLPQMLPGNKPQHQTYNIYFITFKQRGEGQEEGGGVKAIK